MSTPDSAAQRYQRVPGQDASKDVSVVQRLHLDDSDEHSARSSSEVSAHADDIFRGKPFEADDSDVDGALHLRTSRSNSLAELEDWEDDDDDEAGLRRYHFEPRKDMPLPAEFSQESFPKRLWQLFLELQAAARQRRAARLLTMPSQSWQYQMHSCLLTWCCDATDRGIMLVAIWLSLWLLIGIAGKMGSSWWWLGIILFVVRVSARRSFDFLRGKRKQQRQRLSTADAVELRNSSIWSDKNSQHGTSFSGQEVV